MRDPMIKRIPREIRHDMGKYIALFLFLTVMIGFISGFIIGDESLKARYDSSFNDFNVEDGHFVLEKEASERIIDRVTDAGVTVYPLFYKEEKISAEGDADGDEIRIFKVRTEVDLTDMWSGKEPEKPDEIAVDRLYAENNHLKAGDSISAGGQDFTISGLTALSDYSALFKNNSDTMFDATDFTVAIVTDEGFDRIGNRNIKYCYAWRNDRQNLSGSERHQQEEDVKDALIDAVADETLIDVNIGGLFSSWTGSVDDFIDQYHRGAVEDDDDSIMEDMVVSLNRIEDFVGRQSNQAINFPGDDMGKDRIMMTALLYIVIVIMAFTFGITIKSTIENEAKAIGTLRASGYSRGEMLKHYITVPLLVTSAAALAGNVMGYTFMKTICAAMYLHSYSLLPYSTKWSISAFRDTTIVPLIIIFIVVFFVIWKELRLPPLSFLRQELSTVRRKRAIVLRSGSFISRFRARVLIQNIPSYIVMFFGIFFGVIVIMFCLAMLPLLQHYESIIMESGMAEYQYILKEPVKVKTRSAEKYQVNSLKNADSRAEDIMAYGIKQDSMYLSDLDLSGSDGDVIISSAYAAKYELGPGDSIKVKEEYKKKVYTFLVKDVYDYEAQLCIFMDMDAFNRVFDLDKGEYAGYLSDEKLDEIPDNKIASVITKEDYATITKQLDSSMGSLFEMFSVFGIVIFVIVIYLLSKVVIEKNAKSIAMVKILGYSSGEISGIYNRVTTLVVAASLLASLPLGYYAFRLIFYVMMKYYTGWLTFYIDPSVYVKTIAIGMISYLFVHVLQMRRIRKVPMGEVLKGME
ncbi:MAG: FtsX-like permease family protein [Eubacterium sp.]|nr:FtsX-like permease family protein [Eubacterium sp.]